MHITNARVIKMGCQLNSREVSLVSDLSGTGVGENRTPPKTKNTHIAITKNTEYCNERDM